ncbi:hypothetical protein HY492_01615 [Candidatus Woesearchaeota archaeon]|nr:hypothetical protein [Candidatus Woesearchaeota archaeon]
MVKHATITVVAILLAVTIAVSSSPFHDGWAVKKSSNLITGRATEEVGFAKVAVERESFWTSFFKGFFRAVAEEPLIETATDPSTGNRMDDEVAVSEPDFIDDKFAQQMIDDRIPCEIRLGGCESSRDAAQASLTATQADLEACQDNAGELTSALDACKSVEDQFDALMGTLRNPPRPNNCGDWLIAYAQSCNQVCAEKNKVCYGAVIRDLGDVFSRDDVCAPSQCYDDTLPRCWAETSYQSDDRDEDKPVRPFRDCTCC